MPITQGSRLDHLQELRARVDAEIRAEKEIERERVRRRKLMEAARFRRRRSSGPNVVEQRLTRLGVTSADVKHWALGQGLLTEIKRGRLASTLLDAYETRETP